MPHRNRLTIAVLAALAGATSIAAVAQQPRLIIKKLTPLQQKQRPQPQPQPPVRGQDESYLDEMPQDMLTIATVDGWMPATVTNKGVPGVSRTAYPLRNCRQPADLIDIGRVRRNGFRVIEYHLNGRIGPSGYKIAAEGIVRPYSRSGTRLFNAKSPADIEVFSVSPTIFVLDMPVRGKVQRLGCSATWGLAIKVWGPKGIDPYTGKAK
ncbi:hypothetical protein ACVWZA_004280 [Sphingomonas sp. UYAg733]